jgi:hypothetical protein
MLHLTLQVDIDDRPLELLVVLQFFKGFSRGDQERIFEVLLQHRHPFVYLAQLLLYVREFSLINEEVPHDDFLDLDDPWVLLQSELVDSWRSRTNKRGILKVISIQLEVELVLEDLNLIYADVLQERVETLNSFVHMVEMVEEGVDSAHSAEGSSLLVVEIVPIVEGLGESFEDWVVLWERATRLSHEVQIGDYRSSSILDHISDPFVRKNIGCWNVDASKVLHEMLFDEIFELASWVTDYWTGGGEQNGE